MGLHLGAAILQLFPEFAAAPLQRAVARVKQGMSEVKADDDLADQCGKLESDFQLFQIALFHKTKHLVKTNFAIAMLLILFLIIIAYKAEDPISDPVSVIFTFFSTAPAFLTLVVLWWNTRGDLRKLKQQANDLEKRVFRTPS